VLVTGEASVVAGADVGDTGLPTPSVLLGSESLDVLSAELVFISFSFLKGFLRNDMLAVSVGTMLSTPPRTK
jgi:hypothetical protein